MLLCVGCATRQHKESVIAARRRRPPRAAVVQACAGGNPARPLRAQKKARREHTLGRASHCCPWYHLAWERHARDAGSPLCGHGSHHAIRSMPRPKITEGCRRVLLARNLWRWPRVAARRTPPAGPEGGFFATSGAGLPPTPARCCPLRAYCPSRRWSL